MKMSNQLTQSIMMPALDYCCCCFGHQFPSLAMMVFMIFKSGASNAWVKRNVKGRALSLSCNISLLLQRKQMMGRNTTQNMWERAAESYGFPVLPCFAKNRPLPTLDV